jgi:hypothetical protein
MAVYGHNVQPSHTTGIDYLHATADHNTAHKMENGIVGSLEPFSPLSVLQHGQTTLFQALQQELSNSKSIVG